MAATEVRLAPAHLADCVALSAAAGWNQNEADWRLMLELGEGWGLALGDGRLAASTLVLPYGEFAWISMVLVLPEHRRRGYATRLLHRALDRLESQGLLPVLDATPAGREVYRREGFHDGWGFKRYVVTQEGPAGDARALHESDWPWLLELDRAAFGGQRERLLRSLAARMPAAALVVEQRGFVLGRDGRQSPQLGPLVARDAEAAQRLFRAGLRALGRPCYVDLVDGTALEAGGLTLERPFTRMVHGATPAPGEARQQFLVAGPELG